MTDLKKLFIEQAKKDKFGAFDDLSTDDTLLLYCDGKEMKEIPVFASFGPEPDDEDFDGVFAFNLFDDDDDDTDDDGENGTISLQDIPSASDSEILYTAGAYEDNVELESGAIAFVPKKKRKAVLAICNQAMARYCFTKFYIDDEGVLIAAATVPVGDEKKVYECVIEAVAWMTVAIDRSYRKIMRAIYKS